MSLIFFINWTWQLDVKRETFLFRGRISFVVCPPFGSPSVKNLKNLYTAIQLDWILSLLNHEASSSVLPQSVCQDQHIQHWNMACENKRWHRYTLESPVPQQKDKTESMVGGWKTKDVPNIPSEVETLRGLAGLTFLKGWRPSGNLRSQCDKWLGRFLCLWPVGRWRKAGSLESRGQFRAGRQPRYESPGAEEAAADEREWGENILTMGIKKLALESSTVSF